MEDLGFSQQADRKEWHRDHGNGRCHPQRQFCIEIYLPSGNWNILDTISNPLPKVIRDLHEVTEYMYFG